MFSTQHRLRKTVDINAVFTTGRKFHTSFFMLVVKPNNSAISRYAVVVSKKVYKSAVKRNAAKRLLRAQLQKSTSQSNTGFDIVLTVKPKYATRTVDEVKQEMSALLKRANLV